ncbi:hypothetical protein OROMI_012257 [Orobanche minor]
MEDVMDDVDDKKKKKKKKSKDKDTFNPSVKYKIEADGKFGVLNDDITRVYLDVAGYTPEIGFAFPFQIDHRAYLPLKFADHGNERFVHLTYTEKLSDYIQKPNVLSQFFTLPSTSRQYEFVPDGIRSMIWSIVDFIVYIHRKKKVLTSFGIDNLYVRDDEIKICGVKFQDADVAGVGEVNDFRWVASIIGDIFQTLPLQNQNQSQPVPPPHVPPLFSHLQTRLKYNCENVKKGLHPTTIANYNSAFVQTRVATGIVDWGLSHQDGPLYDSLLNLPEIPIQTPNGIIQMPRSPLYNGNIQRLCRNAGTHISENSAKYNLVGVALPGFVVLNHVHADIMIMARFGPWFEEFQNNLFRQNILSYFVKVRFMTLRFHRVRRERQPNMERR